MIFSYLFGFGKVLLPDSAERADPICREVFESCSRSYSVVRISNCGIIFVTADIASVLFHCLLFFKVIDCIFKQRLLKVGLDVLEETFLVAFAVTHLSEDLPVPADYSFDGVAGSVGVVG